MTICAQRSQIRNDDLPDYTEVQSKLGIRRACAGFRCASIAYLWNLFLPYLNFGKDDGIALFKSLTGAEQVYIGLFRKL